MNQSYAQGSALTGDVFLRPPQDLEPDGDVIIKLNKRLYGLRDSGDYWYQTLTRNSEDDIHMEHTVRDAAIFMSNNHDK